MKIRQKVKLTTAKDGSLNYPHSFTNGMMVTWNKINMKLAKLHGCGIVTETGPKSVTVFWQKTGTFIEYSIATMMFSFDVVANEPKT